MSKPANAINGCGQGCFVTSLTSTHIINYKTIAKY